MAKEKAKEEKAEDKEENEIKDKADEDQIKDDKSKKADKVKADKNKDKREKSEDKKDKKEDSTKELENKVKDLENKVSDLEGQVNNWKTDYYKVFADMENLKKRLQKEHDNQLKFMLQSFIEELLPILDNFERSLNVENPSDEVASFLKGNQMIYNQLMEILKKNGVEVIEAEGQKFDPNYHQAVMMVKDDNFESGMVVEELQKGYKLKDRVIRASLVKVSE